MQSHFQLIILDQRFPDRESFGLQKSVSHSAADQELIDFAIDQRFDHRNLVGHFRAAENRDKRMCGIVDDSAQILEFFLHQESRRGLFHEFSDPCCRSMRSMRGAKCVVTVNVAQRRELARGRLVVLLFFRMKPEVLQQQHVAIFQRRNFCGCVFTETVVSEFNRLV